MRLLFLVLSTIFFFSFFAKAQQASVELINPLMGTQSSYRLSSGNTYPGITVPWGMNCWMPQTGKMGDGWAYTYDAEKIRGFKQTHQPSPWINDYGQFSIMPVTGHIKFRENDRASWFSHKAEVAKPYFYSVYLADHDVTAAFTPTERACQFEFTFPKNDSSTIVIDAFNKGSAIEIIPSQRKIMGYTTRNSGGVPANFKNYFLITCDRDFDFAYGWSDSTLLRSQLKVDGNHAGAVIGFKTKKGEKIHLKVASSFISPQQAQLNLDREIGHDDFTTTCEKARQSWVSALGRIKIEGGNLDEQRTFYSCLYRVLMFPRNFYEINEAGKIVHYSPYNGQVLPGRMTTDNGFWDTFRGVFPLITLLYPEHSEAVLEGLANAYKESGWLPEWQSPGHRDCMIGSNSAAIIADAYLKGVTHVDINTLYEGILKNTKEEGPLESVGRKGVKWYNELGYVPYDVGINENAARTLEYAYDDFTISQLGRRLGRPASEIKLFEQRAQNYKNLFDPETSLMRGKNKDGRFMTPFNPFKWGDAFTEGNSWHYTWGVFQDIEGLKRLIGGDAAFIHMLDTVFSLPPIFDDSYYGFPIHEIREMQIMNFGNYAHGNQPIQHMIYLYNYTSQPWKAQYWINEVMNRLYKPTPDGYCGDEDNGQTSAWYVLSALGFYTVCPGTDQYVLGAPRFPRITIQFSNNKVLSIQAPLVSSKNIYVNSITVNGSRYDKNFFTHSLLQQGGTIKYGMQAQPNKLRGVGPLAYPFSMTK